MDFIVGLDVCKLDGPLAQSPTAHVGLMYFTSEFAVMWAW